MILSAHGVAPEVAEEAGALGLIAYDAVCPLVAKVHREVERHHRGGRHIVLVGHEGHPEIVGTLGHAPLGAVSVIRGAADVQALPFPAGERLALAVQTTYSVDDAAEVIAALDERFADVARPGRRRHLLCDHQPAGRRPGDRGPRRRDDRRRRELLLQRLPAGRARRRRPVAPRSSASPVRRSSTGRSCRRADRSESRPPLRRRKASSSDILEALRAAYRLRIEEVSAIEETTEFKRVAIG